MKGCRPLDQDEIKKVVKSFSGDFEKRDRALFLLGLKTGFRISELLSLRIGDVIQGGQIVDRLSVSRRNMKRKTEGRTVILHPEAKETLSAWLVESCPTDALETFFFLSRRGENRPITRVQAWRILNRAFEAAGVHGKTGTHSMRKTFAHRVYDALDGDLIKLQKALGHRNINSTVSYLSFREEEIDQAILAA